MFCVRLLLSRGVGGCVGLLNVLILLLFYDVMVGE